MALTDSLTGACNRRAFDLQLRALWEGEAQAGRPVSLILVDLDNFKMVNDRFGHLAGSWTLREVARLLTENAPPASVIARYGGDEFVAILPNTGLARAVLATFAGPSSSPSYTNSIFPVIAGITPRKSEIRTNV